MDLYLKLTMTKLYGCFKLLLLLCLFGACASPPPVIITEEAIQETVPHIVSEPETVIETTAETVEQPRFVLTDGLDSELFRDLPLVAKNYLRTLSQAFRRQDKEFLLSQGKAQYEIEQRFLMDDETYLALLYRIGPLSRNHYMKPIVHPRLYVNTVRGIEFTGWEEIGPMLEIRGLLHFIDGDTTPCVIMLLWRLQEPRILGAWY